MYKNLITISFLFNELQNAYIEHREVKAAQGVKIAAKDLEKAIAGKQRLIKLSSQHCYISSINIAEEINQNFIFCK